MKNACHQKRLSFKAVTLRGNRAQKFILKFLFAYDTQAVA